MDGMFGLSGSKILNVLELNVIFVFFWINPEKLTSKIAKFLYFASF